MLTTTLLVSAVAMLVMASIEGLIVKNKISAGLCVLNAVFLVLGALLLNP